MTSPVTKIKCLIWDLDDTIWHGTLAEGDDLRLRDGVIETLAELDRRGILHSIASRNDEDLAMAQLAAFEIDHFFLYPRINWATKSESVAQIANDLNLGFDALGFIDDQPYERAEVRYRHPAIRNYDARDCRMLLKRTEFTPDFVTEDSIQRREMYRAEGRRRAALQASDQPDKEFLKSLGMVFTIAPAQEADLRRAEELTMRTNQMNTSGITYGYDELRRFAESPEHLLLMAALEDRFGSYGKIGLALVETSEVWTIRLMLMSCRVVSRGVGRVLLNHVIRLAADRGVKLQAHFRRNDRNRIMEVTYRIAGFRAATDDPTCLVYAGPPDPATPEGVRLCLL